MGTTTRRLFEWDGESLAELERELRQLPPGRYALVPAHEIASEGADPDAPSTHDIAAIEAGLDDVDRGATARWRAVRTELMASIDAARGDAT